MFFVGNLETLKMSKLRDIVENHVETKALEDYYEKDVEQIVPAEMERTLGFLREKGHIEQEVDKILNEFLSYTEKVSPKKRNRKFYKIVYVAVNAIATALISYGVNSRDLILIYGGILLYIIISAAIIFLED